MLFRNIALSIATVITASNAGTALAFDQAKLDTFNVTNTCKYCDLSEAALAERDLRGANLENANLSGAAVLIRDDAGCAEVV